MDFVQNFPPFSIIFCLAAAVVSSALSGKNARKLTVFIVTLVGVMSGFVLSYTAKTASSFVYVMGNFPAPWGNEIRIGVLEAIMATFFCFIMLIMTGSLRCFFNS